MKFVAISILSLILWVCQVTAQTPDLLYIFPNKDIYETGEDMWFKAYLMDRQTLALSDRSQTLYLQVRSETGKVVWSEKYPLTSGRGDGHIYIGENWLQKEYYLEGYTRSSFTTDSTTAILPRRIRVVDRVTQMDSISLEAAKRDSLERQTTKHRFDLFPEGGQLIDGINTIVAFKATYGNGFPEDISGKVMEDDREITAIRSLHDGMGMFAITPRWGKDYKVVLSDGRIYHLPPIERTGMGLRVLRNNESGITIVASASDTIARPFTILAKMRGTLCCTAKGVVRGQQIVRLPKERFPMQGIAEITLTVGDNLFPVAERLVYVNTIQRLNITAQTDRQKYNRRDEGKVCLQVTDPGGKPLKAELAVSIFDKAYLYLPGHENILSHCYLSEEIQGNIFNPTYYFDERNEDRLQALNLLLMTQGWRRYVWDKEPAQGRPLLTDGVSGKDLVARTQFIQVFSPQSDTCLVMSDSIGRFEIIPAMMDAMRGNIYLKPMVKSPKPKLSLINPFDSISFHQQGRPRYLPQNHIFETANGERDITNAFGTVVLKDVYVTAKRRSPYRDKVTGYLDSLAIMASGEWVCKHGGQMYLNDYHGYTHHPEDCFCPPSKVEHLMPKRGEIYRVIKYVPGGRYLVDIDMNDPPHDIVYNGPQYTEEELLKKYGMSKAQGYYPRREFYEPDVFDLSSPTPDSRNSLQWKPAILTDENGKADITFTASDVNTEFIGIIEAIDGTGLMDYQTFTFRIIRNK